MAGKDTAVLRDFVYLDWERVRSMTAQLFRGVPVDATNEKGHEITGRGQLEGSLLKLIKAQGGADYRYFRTGNETRSFHHYVYSLLEDRLLQEGMVTNIDVDFDHDLWSEDFFHDGQFVRVVGLVRLMDYAWVSKMMTALPRMMRTAQHAENLALKEQRNMGIITQKEFNEKQKQQQQELNEIKALKMDELTDLISQLYGDVVRVKVLPNDGYPENVFIGSGDLVSFHDSAASLVQKYGYEIDADWVTLGQINLSQASGVPASIPTGNPMEDSFEQIALAFNDIIRMASAAEFPTISLTPISIYRTVRP